MHERVWEVLSTYDLFFLPTRGENFWPVILESMLAGTPVLLSNTTPWRDLESLGIGWDLPLASEGAFISAIQSVAGMRTDLPAWRSRARKYALERCSDLTVLAANQHLFLTAIDRHNAPPGVASCD